MSRNAAQLLRQNTQETFAYEIPEEFRNFLESWNSYSEPYDTPLNAWLHESYAKVLSKGGYLDYRSLPCFFLRQLTHVRGSFKKKRYEVCEIKPK
ncbi:hypothetical protein ACT7DQ_27430 [Bacillus cereus]